MHLNFECRVPPRCENVWSKVKFRHATLHRNVGQKPCKTATPKT